MHLGRHLVHRKHPDLDLLVHRLLVRASQETDHGDQPGNGAEKAQQPQRDSDVHRHHAPLHVLCIGDQPEQDQQEAEDNRNECVPEMRLHVASHTTSAIRTPKPS